MWRRGLASSLAVTRRSWGNISSTRNPAGASAGAIDVRRNVVLPAFSSSLSSSMEMTSFGGSTGWSGNKSGVAKKSGNHNISHNNEDVLTIGSPYVGACRFRSNRSRRGLYDGKDIRTGNNVSFSMKSTKRKFKPNVFIKRVYSEILDEMIRFHLTTSALRSIDKAGGLDNYLLTSRHVTSGEGKVAKDRIINRLKFLSREAKRQAASEAATEESK